MENTLATADLSPDDKRRVEVLKRYRILGTPPEQSFDNIAKLAIQIFDLPVSLISFIDTENVFLKSNMGVEEIRNSPRSNSICAMALGTDEVTVVEDIPHYNQHLMTDPLLVAEMGFKFYAGAPLITHDGFTIGTICVIGRETRAFSEKESKMLKGLARIVMDEIELRLRGIFDAEKRVMEAARISQLNFNNQSLIANAPMAIGILSGRSLTVELANPIILEVWGKTDVVIGKPLKEALPELEGQGFLQILDDVFLSGIPYYGKEACVELLRNGVMEDVYFNFVYQPLKDAEGVTTSIMIVANEVTEDIKERKALQISEKQLENMVANSTTGMAIYSGRELIVDTANQPMLDIWEKTARQVIGRSLHDLFPNSNTEGSIGTLIQVFETGETASFPEVEITMKTATGFKDLVLNISYVPIFDDEDQVQQIIASVSDITKIVNARKILERLETERDATHAMLISTIQDFTTANKDMQHSHSDLTATRDLLKSMRSRLDKNQPGMLHSLNKIEEGLLKADEALKSAAGTSPIGIWNIEIATMQCNPTAGLKLLYGYHPDDVMSLPNAMAQITDDYRDKVLAAIDVTIKQGTSFSYDYPTIGFHDQKIRWLRTFGKLDYTDGVATHFSGVAFEIAQPEAQETA